MLARQAGVAPVVADDQFNRSARGPRIRRPQHEPPLRIDAHWRQRPGERDGEPDAQPG